MKIRNWSIGTWLLIGLIATFALIARNRELAIARQEGRAIGLDECKAILEHMGERLKERP